MKWKQLVLKCVEDLCAKKGSNMFNTSEIYEYEAELSSHYPQNHTVKEKIRQQLQYLRNDGHIVFLDNNGNYMLRK